MRTKLSPEMSWKRAVFLRLMRQQIRCNTEFGEYIDRMAGRHPLLTNKPSANVVAKLILCASYLKKDEYILLGYGRAAELMNRVEDFHCDYPEAWEELRDLVIDEYLSQGETREKMNKLIKSHYP